MQEYRGIRIPQSLDEVIRPQETALIVYDMQAGITKQISNGAEIVKNVARVVDAARSTGIRTFFTRHMSLPTELMGAFQFKMAMAWQRADSPEKVKTIFSRDNPAFQIIPELAPRASEGIVDKISMSAFEGTYLEMALRDCGVRSFIICGIALEIGIDPTCRQGADLGLWPILVQDACGFGNEEAANHSLASLKHMGDTIVTDVETVCGLLGIPSKSS
ncbi:MAG TPA: cysteine hydrolase [Candidatus Eisenbacteria bacterium]|nr:cysteine hydrolase [Candidatus Eisenbacteria bacterium]